MLRWEDRGQPNSGIIPLGTWQYCHFHMQVSMMSHARIAIRGEYAAASGPCVWVPLVVLTVSVCCLQRGHSDVLASRYGDLSVSEARYRPADPTEGRKVDGRNRKAGARCALRVYGPADSRRYATCGAVCDREVGFISQEARRAVVFKDDSRHVQPG